MRAGSVAPAVAVLAALALTGACTPSASGPASPTSTRTVVHTALSTPEADYRPPPARSQSPLPPGANPPAGEVDRRCPYIKTGLDQDGYHVRGPNVADIEGDRIYRTTVLVRLHPVGCRFYFSAPPYEAVADIVPRRFASAAAAHNAMVRTAEAGTEVISAPGFADGVDGISYRTRFFGPDGARDWAFVFAAGRTMVVVRTQRSDTSQPALYLARAVVGSFR